MTSGKKSTCNSSGWFGSGERSLNGNSGIQDVCVEHILGGVWRQVRIHSYRRDIDGRLSDFALEISILAG